MPTYNQDQNDYRPILHSGIFRFLITDIGSVSFR